MKAIFEDDLTQEMIIKDTNYQLKFNVLFKFMLILKSLKQ